MEKSESKQSLSNEFENVPINDQRLINRLIVTAEILENQPEKSIPDACGNWAATKATYQLFANEKVTSEAILNSHRLNTIERIGKYPVVLLIQDTSTIDFSTHKKTEGLGSFTSGKYSYGLLMHSVLAVSPNGVPLGLLYQYIWARETSPKYTKRDQHRELPIEAKESHKWLKALDDSLNGLPNPMSTVTIADREADIYEFFKKAHELGTHLLIRATRNRRILEECKLLFDQIEQAPEVGQCVVDIPRRSDQNVPPRQAKLSVRYRRVTVCPAHCHIKEPKETITLYAILAREIEFPEGEEPVEWFLLTTIPVGSLEEAIQKIEWYRERWKIERFHYILKSGCNIEDLQLETKERLENAITLYSVIAWRLSWLIYQARVTPDFFVAQFLKSMNGKHYIAL
jgi:Transposase DDE domain.